ncbi:MAG: bile acid:Na+ symporter, family [Clostridia bacterium]|nr:bile acid:Na+ symporter, family [Clostridia bacterium]
MINVFAAYNEWLGRRMFFVVSTALLVGFLLSKYIAPSLSNVAVVLFGYMTFITALDTSYRNFFNVLKKPGIILWMLLLIHIIMPVISWVIGMIFYPADSYVRLGLIIGALIPIAVTSIIWTSVLKGDIALTLVAVTIDTLVSPFLLPLFIFIIVGETVQIDYMDMFFGLLWMVTVPSMLGMALNDLTKGGLKKFGHSIGGLTSKIALFFVVVINAGLVAPEVDWDISLAKMLLVLLLIAVCGFGLGYLGSYVLKHRSWDSTVSMIYIVGMRNISFGSVLAVTYFPPAVAVPVTLAMLFQQPLAGIVAYLLNRSLHSRLVRKHY